MALTGGWTLQAEIQQQGKIWCVCMCVSAGVGMLIHFLAQLHSACGPLVTEATDGSSQVMARTAAQMAMQVGILFRGLAVLVAAYVVGKSSHHEIGSFAWHTNHSK